MRRLFLARVAALAAMGCGASAKKNVAQADAAVPLSMSNLCPQRRGPMVMARRNRCPTVKTQPSLPLSRALAWRSCTMLLNLVPHRKANKRKIKWKLIKKWQEIMPRRPRWLTQHTHQKLLLNPRRR